LLRVILDPEEHPWLRETLTGDLAIWGERISDELCSRCLRVLSQQSALPR